jgi:predicted outer membrane protein
MMKLIKPLAAILLIAAPLGAAQARGDMPAKTYVMKAGASDLFERQSAALMTRSQNADVRAFAKMMARDHAASTSQVKAAARRPATSRLCARQTARIATGCTSTSRRRRTATP